MVSPLAARRLLLVHAHPDDESIGTGATMAAYAAGGAQVTLVTCTLGELGEIIPPSLAHLAWDRDNRLGEYRVGELAAACAALGVSDHRFLGGAGRWRDSGMMGAPSNDWPGSFWRAGLDEPAAALATVIREVRPQVIVSYDGNGFYGHPDHIQAHRVTWRAFGLAAGSTPAAPGPGGDGPGGDGPGGDGPGGGVTGAPWRARKLYATAMPRSALAGALRLTPVGGDPAGGGGRGAHMPGARDGRPGFRQASLDDLPFGVPDEQVTTEIDATGHLAAKLAAMAAHATQISVDGPFYALSDHVGLRALGREYYTLLAGPRGEGGWPGGREDDLFAGL